MFLKLLPCLRYGSRIGNKQQMEERKSLNGDAADTTICLEMLNDVKVNHLLGENKNEDVQTVLG